MNFYVLGCFLATLALARCAETPCDIEKVKSCVNDFRAALNIPEDALKDPKVFGDSTLAKFIAGGKEFYDKLCGEGAKVRMCLTPKGCNVDSKMAQEAFGLTAEQAKVFAVIRESVRYSCGPANEVYSNNIDCITNTMKDGEKLDKAKECRNKLVDSLAGMETHGPECCKHFKEYKDCANPLFDCGEEVAKTTCKQLQAGAKVMAPTCDLECEPARLWL